MYRWQIRTRKNVQHHKEMSIIISSSQGDINIHTSERLNQNWHQKLGGNTKCWWGCRETGSLMRCWCECKMVQPLWKTVWRFPEKLNMRLPTQHSNRTPGHFPRGMKTYVCTETQTQMFMLAYIHNSLKLETTPKCPSIDEWLNKLQHIHITQYNLAIKRNETLIPAIPKTTTTIPENYAELKKKAYAKGYILYDPIYA